MHSMPDSAALRILFRVELMLLLARDVAAIGAGVRMILRGDRAVCGALGTGLCAGDLALPPFPIDPGNLMMLAGENFVLAGMVARPAALG